MNTAAQAVTPIAAATARFVDNGDGTITDTQLNVMWSKATLTDAYVTHAQAEKLCADLDLGGHTDWRLPTRIELLALVDDTRYRPAIDSEAFPDTRSDDYWTGTTCAWSSVRAWFVGFNGGLASDFPRDYNLAFVRAVRSVPAGQ